MKIRSPLPFQRIPPLLALVALMLGWCGLPLSHLPPTAGAAPLSSREERAWPAAGPAADLGLLSAPLQVTTTTLLKTVAPEVNVPYHGVVTYTVVLSNSSVVSDTGAVLTDTLPTGVSFGQWVEEPPSGLIQNGNAITWTGVLIHHTALTFTFTVTHTGGYGDVITNTAYLSSLLGQDQDSAVFVVCLDAVTVQNAGDSGPGSLRQAIADVCPDGRIDFAGSLAGQTITLTTPLVIDKNLAVDGSSLASPIQISGNDSVRVFRVTGGAHVTLDTLRIVRGREDTPECQGGVVSCGGGLKVEAGAVMTLTQSAVLSSTAGVGGGLYNSGTLIVTDSTLSGNLTGNAGGGILNEGAMTVTGSTFSGNSAGFAGGGIWNEGAMTVAGSTLSRNSAGQWGGGIDNASGTLTVADSTLSGNSALEFGGGILNDGTLRVENSTLSGNSADLFGGGIMNYGMLTMTHGTLSGNSALDLGGGLFSAFGTLNYAGTLIANSPTGGDCYIDSGTIGINTNNLVEDGSCGAALSGDPLLDALADNSGDTFTFALLPGSPALDAVPVLSCTLATDQRGVSRPQPAGGNCDIGAFESRGFALAFTSTPVTTTVEDTLYTYNVTAQGPDASPHGLTITAPVLPGWLALADSGDGTATLAGTPTQAEVGYHLVTLQVEDSWGDTDSQSFIITVLSANSAPVAVGEAYTTTVGTVLIVAAPGVLGNDGDIDGDPLTAVLDTPPASGILALNADGLFIYVPAPGFTGLITFTYHASDSQAASAPAVVAITVQEAAWQAFLPVVFR